MLAASTCFLAACGGGEDPPKLPAAGTTQDGEGSARSDGLTDGDDAAGSAEEGDEKPAKTRGRSNRRGRAGDDASGDDNAERPASGDDTPSGAESPDPPAGGGDEQEARAFVEDYVARYARGDGSICTDVFTARHVETLTGRKGDAAIDKCRKDISGQRRPFRLVELKAVDRLDERRLRVTAILASGNRGYRSVLELLRAGGALRIDGAG